MNQKYGNYKAAFIKPAAITFIACIIIICLVNMRNSEKSLNSVLEKAGANKKELQLVIEYFKKDKNPKKLEAATFLIKYLDLQYYYSGNAVKKYRKSFKSMDSLFNSNHGIFNSSWDSIQKLNPPSQLSDAEIIKDLTTIKSEYLIRHINAAFKAWSYPWATSLDFKQFCENILPYKLVNEEPDLWMESIQKKYSWLSDSMGTSKDQKRACILLNNSLRREYNLNGRFKCQWDVNYTDLCKIRQGQCIHLTQLTTYVMRAMGIPVTMDFTPHWANKNSGHGWNGLLNKGKDIVFMGCESNPGMTKLEFTRTEWMIRKIAKVYRKMYNGYEGNYFKNIRISEIDNFFYSGRNLDITEKYLPVSDIKLSIKNAESAKLAYLCVFNTNSWQTVNMAKIDIFSRAQFSNMGRGIMYMPMVLKGDLLEPAGTPFLLTQDGEVKEYAADKNKSIDCYLDKKYPEDKSNLIEKGLNYELFYWSDEWISLRKKKAAGKVLKFNGVPSNCLLLLRCLDKGKQERIFTYEQGKQIWW